MVALLWANSPFGDRYTSFGRRSSRGGLLAELGVSEVEPPLVVTRSGRVLSNPIDVELRDALGAPG